MIYLKYIKKILFAYYNFIVVYISRVNSFYFMYCMNEVMKRSNKYLLKQEETLTRI
jgi:hypothetical protein